MTTTFVAFGDIHARDQVELDRLVCAAAAARREVPHPAAVLVTGDLGEPRRQSEEKYQRMAFQALRILKTTFRDVPLLFVPGNHDRKDMWAETVGNLDGTWTTVGGLVIAGVGGATGSFGFPYEPTDTEMSRVLGRLPDKVDILLTHQPPWGVKSGWCARNVDGGSRPIRDFVLEHQPKVHICGHIHEAFGVERLDTTVVVNVGSFGRPFEGCRYAVVTLDRRGPTTDRHARIVEVT